MNDSSMGNRTKVKLSNLYRNGLGAWGVLAVLSALLIASVVIGYLGWTGSDNSVPTSGYIAMTFGVLFSLAVGIGFMALIFYSSRKGYDEPAVLVPDETLDDPQQKRT